MNTKKMSKIFFVGFILSFLIEVEFFYVVSPLTESYTLMILLQLIAVLSIFVSWILCASRKIKIDFFAVLFFLFFSDVTLSAVLSHSAKLEVDLIFFWSSFFILMLACNVKKFTIEDFILKAIVYLGLFFSIGVFLQMIFTETFEVRYFSLFKGAFKESVYRQVIYHQMYTGWTSQTFATCANLGIAIFASWFLWNKKKQKRWLLCFIVNIAAMLLTGKRGPVIFAICSLLFVNLILTKGFQKALIKIWKYLIGAFAAGIGILIYVSMQISTSRNTIVRFMEMFQGGTDDVSNGRFALWKLAIDIFQENPVFGIGWRMFPQRAVAIEGIEMYTHNVYLEVLAEQGIAGFILYNGLILYAIIDVFLLIKKRSNMEIGEGIYLLKFSLVIQVFLLIYSLTGNVLYDYNMILLYFFAVALYLYEKNNAYITKEEINEKICNVHAWWK